MTEKEEVISRKEILTSKDFKGFLHNHFNWPEPYPPGGPPTDDGAHSIEELAKAFVQKGYSYLGISPHNIPTEKEAQWLKNMVSEINNQNLGIRLFLGIEVNINADGSLAFPPEILRPLDYVIASLHFWDKREQNGEQNNQAVIKAIESGWVDIIGHLSHATYDAKKKEPMNIDFEKVGQAAKHNHVAIEIPLAQFDLPQMPAIERRRQELIVQAIKNNLLVTFDFDLHDIKHFQIERLSKQVSTFVNFGGKKENVINTWQLKDIKSWTESKKAKR